MEPKFKLPSQPKIATGFSVPEGYFEAFSEQILTRLPKEKSKVIPLNPTGKRWYFAAASLVVGLLSLSLYLNYQNREQELDAVTIENYLTYHAAVSEEDIVNLLDEKDLEKMKLDLNIADKDLEDALDATPNIEQYLID
jgi:hypothetical protein